MVAGSCWARDCTEANTWRPSLGCSPSTCSSPKEPSRSTCRKVSRACCRISLRWAMNSSRGGSGKRNCSGKSRCRRATSKAASTILPVPVAIQDKAFQWPPVEQLDMLDPANNVRLFEKATNLVHQDSTALNDAPSQITPLEESCL